jgi:AcrR family transcriptional regulator
VVNEEDVMPGIQPADTGPLSVDLAVRAPRQQRTREQWSRVLDAGVELLEEGGYDAFTIAALCERARVPPRALYARTDTKDGLFLAVYERGMSRVLADHAVFADPGQWRDDDHAHLIELAVRRLVGIFIDHEAFLRAVVLISNAHPEVLRRGAAYVQAIRDLFVSVLTTAQGPPATDSHDLEFCFSMVFSAMVLRVAYGPGFGPPGDTESLTRDLVTMAQRFLRSSGVDLGAEGA